MQATQAIELIADYKRVSVESNESARHYTAMGSTHSQSAESCFAAAEHYALKAYHVYLAHLSGSDTPFSSILPAAS